MPESGSSYIALAPGDVTVDAEGRVVITSPQVSEMIKAAVKPVRAIAGANSNCAGGTCNFVPNCGALA
jgi:hypothetical protein